MIYQWKIYFNFISNENYVYLINWNTSVKLMHMMVLHLILELQISSSVDKFIGWYIIILIFMEI